MSDQGKQGAANELDLPSHGINEDGSITWEGRQLKVSDLQPVLFAVRKASGILREESIQSAKKRWESALKLALATLARLPPQEELTQAIPELPPAPFVPDQPREPKGNNIESGEYHFRKYFYEHELEKWKKALHLEKEYQQKLPLFRKWVELWHKYGGAQGVNRFLAHRKHFPEIAELLARCIENPEIKTASVPFEVLPAGFWSTERLLSHLGGRNWKVQEIVAERLDHLGSLEPIRIYEGKIQREYRDYLIYIFADDGSAVLESPFHGNATYLLKKDWFRLCQKTKSELIRDDRVERIIHHDIPSWQQEICLRLGKKMPNHSNEY